MKRKTAGSASTDPVTANDRLSNSNKYYYSQDKDRSKSNNTVSDKSIIQIREDGRNYRTHDRRNLDLIGKSLDDNGCGRSIVCDNTGVIIGGNGTFREARKRGIPLNIVHTDGDSLTVVVRDDISPDDPRRKNLAVLDNSTSDSSAFDLDLLSADFETEELELLGVSMPVFEPDSETGTDDTESGEDADIERMSFVFTKEQANAVKNCLERIRASEKFRELAAENISGDENSEAVVFALKQSVSSLC